jgi:hypothetical protein
MTLLTIESRFCCSRSPIRIMGEHMFAS